MIMAGGSGTRLWPMSRGNTPKQLIELFGGKSLLEIASDRLHGIVEPDRRWICANQEYADDVCKQLQIPASQMLGEPVGRDTLNAVGFTATVLHKLDPDAVFAVTCRECRANQSDRYWLSRMFDGRTNVPVSIDRTRSRIAFKASCLLPLTVSDLCLRRPSVPGGPS